MDKTKGLGTQAVGQLLAKFSIPAVIAMLVNAIYNVVDRIFIGQFAGEEALAGLTVAFPVMMVIFAFASLIGMGGSSLLSIRLGQQDIKGANHVFGNTLVFGLIVTSITLLTVFINLDGLLGIFGATPDVLRYSADYMTIILGGFIFQMISFSLNGFVRTEGNPIFSMVAMIASALTNILLDYIFIGIFDMGVKGAAYATILGQFAGLSILVSFYLRGKSSLRLRAKHLIPDFKVLSQIVSIGFATFISTLGTSVAMTFMNRGLVEYGGTAAITSMGAINSLFTFFMMPLMGITQGMQPIIGYNYGANQLDRSNKTLKLAIMVGVGFSTLMFAVMELFPTTFVSLFLDKGSSTMDIAVNGLRIYLIMMPLLSINLMGVAYYQSIAKGRVSMILGMLRQFVFLIPLLLILPGFLGLNGVWIAVPIADGLAIAVTGVMLWIENKKEINNRSIGKKPVANAV